jgi:hypothetical protein
VTKKNDEALLNAALAYAEQGFAVFPCGDNKQPLTKHGFEDAASEPEQIKRWWARNPDALIGMAIPDGVIIVDVDPRNGGKETMRELRREHGRNAFPDTRRSRTGGGGTHLWYAADGEAPMRGKLGRGVDVKRAGKGYAIVPPSVTDSAYVWDNELDFEPAPEWMLAALRKPERGDRGNAPPSGAPAVFPFMDGTSYGVAAMDAELSRLAEAEIGERNDALNAAAYSLAQLVAGGELKEDPVRERLTEGGLEIGLEEREVELTVDSAFEAGMREPRNAPPMDDKARGQRGSGDVRGQLPDDPNDGEHFWLDLSGDTPDPEYILDPVLPRDAYVLVYGAAEASKSMVMGALGAQASCRGFSVSVYSLENPPVVDKQRFQRLGYCKELFRVTNQLINLADPEQAKAMAIREEGRDLVIIDTYSHAFAQRYDTGDGNARAIEFARVVRWLMRKTGATFVVIDHTGFERPEEPRDASAKRQQVDVAIGMERPRAWERGKPAYFRMTNYKSARFGNPFSIDGKIVGGPGEPLRVEFSGTPMKWGDE